MVILFYGEMIYLNVYWMCFFNLIFGVGISLIAYDLMYPLCVIQTLGERLA